MRFEFKPSFDRSVKNFHGKEKEEIKEAALKAIDILSQDRLIHIRGSFIYDIFIKSE